MDPIKPHIDIVTTASDTKSKDGDFTVVPCTESRNGDLPTVPDVSEDGALLSEVRANNDRCQFWLKRKRRNCRAKVIGKMRYCVEHSLQAGVCVLYLFCSYLEQNTLNMPKF